MPRKRRKRKPKAPRDREIRDALIESGMPEGEAANAVSHLLRLFNLDFFRRRRNRLLNLIQDRLLVVAAKTKLLDLLKREGTGRGRSFNLEDLITGLHHRELMNLGEVVIRRAIREMVSEDLIRARAKGASMELLSLTGRRPAGSGAKLRDVYERMRLAMGVRGAKPYLIEKTWDL
jgi:hypothetical protein